MITILKTNTGATAYDNVTAVKEQVIYNINHLNKNSWCKLSAAFLPG